MEIIYKNLKKLKSLRSVMVTASSVYDYYLPKNSELFANFGREIPHLEHFYTDFMLEQSTIIDIIKTSRNLKTFCVALFKKVCPMNIGFLKTLADARKSLFETGCGKIFVLDLVFFPPRKRTPHRTVSNSIANARVINVVRSRNKLFSFVQIELNAEMADYITVSFLKSSAEKYFVPDLMYNGFGHHSPIF